MAVEKEQLKELTKEIYEHLYSLARGSMSLGTTDLCVLRAACIQATGAIVSGILIEEDEEDKCEFPSLEDLTPPGPDPANDLLADSSIDLDLTD